jgi:hypothetical protein
MDATYFLIAFKPIHNNIVGDITDALQPLVDQEGRTESGAFLSVDELPKCFKPDLTKLQEAEVS